MSTERLADHLVAYLYEQYRGSRHVRRVATWLGFLLKGIEYLPGVEASQRRTRQIEFTYRSRTFKAKYDHKAGPRGGIAFVEVLPGRGQPEGGVVLQVASLDDAENAYRGLKGALDAFIAANPG